MLSVTTDCVKQRCCDLKCFCSMPVIFRTSRVMLMLAAAFIPQRIFFPLRGNNPGPFWFHENHNNPQHYFPIPPCPYPRPISTGQPADRDAIVPSNLEATVATVSPQFRALLYESLLFSSVYLWLLVLLIPFLSQKSTPSN